MAYSPHYRVRVSGVFANDLDNPYEIWSWGFQYGSAATEVPPVDPISETVFNGIVSNVIGMHSDPPTKISTQCRLTEIKVSAITNTGHVATEADGSYRQRVITWSPEDNPGAGGSLLHPPQIAMCCTLQAVRPGRHGHGRFYLPGCTAAVTQDGVISGAVRDGIATSVGSTLNAINALDASANAICVAGSDGITSPVNILRIGMVLDTQRRRRNAMAENYVLTAITG